jgi:hypothetical protein
MMRSLHDMYSSESLNSVSFPFPFGVLVGSDVPFPVPSAIL